jgi:hypothetical protein
MTIAPAILADRHRATDQAQPTILMASDLPWTVSSPIVNWEQSVHVGTLQSHLRVYTPQPRRETADADTRPIAGAMMRSSAIS